MKNDVIHNKPTRPEQREPFSLQPDQRFYYPVESFEQRLTLLKMLVQGADTLILVIGEPGSGKTTLLNRYLATNDLEWESYRIRAHSATRRQQRQEAHRPYFTAFVLKKASDPIVIMDDAHAINRKNLQFLLRKMQAPGGLNGCRRLVLFGNPELVKRISHHVASVTNKIAVNKIFLSPLTVEDTAAYLRHRLAVSGHNGQSLLTAETVKRLHKKSDGLPGRINQNARRWLEKNRRKKTRSNFGVRPTTSRFRPLVIWSAIACMAIVPAIILLYIYGLSPPSPETIQTRSARVITVKILDNRMMLKPRSEIARSQSPGSQIRTRPAQAARAEIIHRPSDSPSAGTTHKPSVPDKTPAIPKPAPADSIVAAAPASKPEMTDAPIVAAKPPQKKVYRENWLQAQNPSQYTIQLIGVRSEPTLLRFIAENLSSLNRQQVAYYRSNYKSENWFPLLYGVYASKTEARSAIDGLPENIRKQSPWIRTLAAVQNDIKRRKKP